jgi:tetratricopeptide (TPR) repeat protein
MRNAAVLALLLPLLHGDRAFAQVPGEAQLNIAHPLPPQSPAWLPGYQVRWPVRVVGEASKQEAQTVIVTIPTGGWLKPDASDLAVQTADGKVAPLAILSHDPTGDTLIQFKRRGNDPWYWVYGVGPPAPRLDPKTDAAFREGLTVEVRNWAGGDLGSWAKVRVGLEKSAHVLGNAIVSDVIQQGNPSRPDRNNNFAASYRGFFAVKKEGTYRFLVNAEDASFLFIDGFKVFERPGENKVFGQIKLKELEKVIGKLDLKPGVHAFEVHQAIGGRGDVNGTCALLWAPPGEAKLAYLPSDVMVRPLYGRVATTEKPAGDTVGPFLHGLDDTLEVPGLKLFLMRFEALGPVKAGASFVWDFGDGTTGKGRSVTHIYFKEGDYPVVLTCASGLPPYRRTVHVWPEPGETNPLSLDLAVKTLEGMDWKKLSVTQIRSIFAFLTVCDQPSRWPLLDAVAQHLLAQKDFDLEVRSQLHVARIEALTEMGRAADALKLAAKALPDFTKTPALQVRLQLAEAAVHQYHYHDAAAASKIYKAILDEHRRVEHPNLRVAAVRWGDLFAEAGDLTRASETYRIAATLGGEKLIGTATTEASTRGALLRIAEQKLKEGDIHATRQLLERLEVEYPGRRLDGLYCFLRAEADRHAGRYEDALRHYEMIFKLPQWAGYRDRATFGIADTYLRTGELDKAAKWLADLREGFPKLYETQKGGEIDKLLAERRERIKAARAKGEPDDGLFKGFATGFEPDEPAWFGDLKDIPSVRAPGMRGPHTLLLDAFAEDKTLLTYQRPLKGLRPGATYWCEIWYRDLVRVPPPPPGVHPFLHMILTGTAAPKPSVVGQPSLLRNSYQQWHKAGFKLKAPLAQDFDLFLHFYYLKGAYLFDRLSIRAVSDRQLEALTTFQEGPKTP